MRTLKTAKQKGEGGKGEKGLAVRAAETEEGRRQTNLTACVCVIDYKNIVVEPGVEREEH